MDTANFLAILWGFSFIILGFAFLLNSKNIKTLFKLAKDEKMLFLVGIINVVFAITLLLLYHGVDASWRIIITILSLLVIARGKLLLFAPNFVSKMVSKLEKYPNAISITLVVAIILGCALVYAGFIL